VGSCEHGNELWGSIKCWKFLKQMRGYNVLMVCARWKYSDINKGNALNPKWVVAKLKG